MKRDFLKQLGLEDGQVEEIMAEYGRSVERVRQLHGEQEARATQLAAQLAAQEQEHQVELALVNAKARNVKAARALLPSESELPVAEQIAALQASDPYLFQAEEEGGFAYAPPGGQTPPDPARLSDEEFYRLATQN